MPDDRALQRPLSEPELSGDATPVSSLPRPARMTAFNSEYQDLLLGRQRIILEAIAMGASRGVIDRMKEDFKNLRDAFIALENGDPKPTLAVLKSRAARSKSRKRYAAFPLDQKIATARLNLRYRGKSR